jgi:flavocytochrome c
VLYHLQATHFSDLDATLFPLGAGTSTQVANGVIDSREIFYNDTAKSAGEGLRPALVKTLTYESGPAVEWLIDSFDLDLTKVARLGAHSSPRTHRGEGGRFPGAMITMTLMEKYDEIMEQYPNRARLIPKSSVSKLISDDSGSVIGCEFENREGVVSQEYGPVIVSTGGFGADFSSDSLLSQVYPEWKNLTAWNEVRDLPNLLDLPTTNGDHCSGDGIKLAMTVGASTCDMEAVQVHPTGLVDPEEPNAKVRFLAAEALRGVGGILLDKDGQRFCDDLGKRDYVSGRMWNNTGPFFNGKAFGLVLNGKASEEIGWHCKHYASRGLMKQFKSGKDLAMAIGCTEAQLKQSFDDYNKAAETGKDKFDKKYFHNGPFTMDDSFYMAAVGPVIHYTMGGIEANEHSECVNSAGDVIPGLYAAGEVMGGIHGKNRLGGNSLLDCVVYGRVSGATASKYMLENFSSGSTAGPVAGGAAGRVQRIGQHLDPAAFGVTIQQGGVSTTVSVMPGSQTMSLDVNWNGDGAAPTVTTSGGGASAPAAAAAPPAEEAAPAGADPNTPMAFSDVEAHTAEDDCWLVVDNKVYDLTEFLPDHPGGKKAPLIYAGKDATEEFNMLHKPEILDKYAKQYQVGVISK